MRPVGGHRPLSKRTWACIECGKTFRRDQTVQSVRCAHCGQPCEYVHWKIHIPSPKNRKEWNAFWRQYREEKRQLEAFHNGTLTESVRLEILNMQLNV